jgi:hypothetical protein
MVLENTASGKLKGQIHWIGFTLEICDYKTVSKKFSELIFTGRELSEILTPWSTCRKAAGLTIHVEPLTDCQLF